MKIDFKVRKRTDGDIVCSIITYNSKRYNSEPNHRYTDYIPKFDLFWIFNYTTEKMIITNVHDFGFHAELDKIFNSKLHNYVE